MSFWCSEFSEQAVPYSCAFLHKTLQRIFALLGPLCTLQVFDIQICVCACGWVSKSEFLFDWVSVTSLLGRHSTGHVWWLVPANFWQPGATWCWYNSVSMRRNRKKIHKAFQPLILHEDLLGRVHRITMFKLIIFLSWSNHTPLLDFFFKALMANTGHFSVCLGSLLLNYEISADWVSIKDLSDWVNIKDWYWP